MIDLNLYIKYYTILQNLKTKLQVLSNIKLLSKYYTLTNKKDIVNIITFKKLTFISCQENLR